MVKIRYTGPQHRTVYKYGLYLNTGYTYDLAEDMATDLLTLPGFEKAEEENTAPKRKARAKED